MKNNMQTLIICLTALGISACTYKKADNGAHQGAVSTDLTVAPEVVQEADAKNTAVNVDLNQVYKSLVEAKSSAEIIKTLVLLEAQVITQTHLLDTNQTRSESFKNALSYYNYGMIRLNELSPNTAELDQAFARYENLALAGCDANMNSCTNTAVFKLDQRSSKVIQLLASRLDERMKTECKGDCADLLKKYYGYLGVAFDSNNAVRNNDLEFLYIKHAQEYGSVFKKSNPSDKAFFNKHGAIFESIVSQYPADTKNEKFAAFVKAFKPWNYSRMNENPFPFGYEKMFSFAATNYLYEADGKTLNVDLQKSILANQDIADKTGPSFSMLVKDLKANPRSNGIFKGLQVDLTNVDTPDFLNEYFYMVDGLYRGHFGLDEVNSLWIGSKKDERALLKVVNTYIKVEFIQRIVNTNSYMGNVFIQKNIPSDTLFQQAIQKSEPLTKDWSEMLSKMDRISIFITQQLRTSKSSSSTLAQAQLMIDSVKRNAKFLSVYPNMLILGYFMIDLNAPLKFQTWWGGEVSVDPTTIMSLMLDGGFDKPWFLFGGDSAPLNKTEMIFAYYYALNAGAFETFSVVKDAQGKSILDRVSFFKKAIKKTIQGNVDTLNEALQKLRDSRDSNPLFSSFLNACNNENANSKDYTVSMKLVDLQNFALFGDVNHGLLNAAFAPYQGGGGIGTISDIRNNYEIRLVQIKSMMDILQQNLKTIQTSRSELDQTIKDLNGEIEGLEANKKQFLSEVVAHHRLVSKCLTQMQNLERERQSQLFTKEIKYLGDIYDSLIVLKDLKGDAKKAKATELSTSLGLQPTENISSDIYTYSRLDLLNRMAKYSSSLKPQIVFESPDSSTKDTLVNQIETVQFIHPVTHNVVSKDTFINAGMTILNPQGSSALMWLQETASIAAWQNKISAMASIYRLGYDVGVAQDPNQTITADEIISETVEMARFVNITDTEKVWLKRMNRRERIPRDKLDGFLFDSSESQSKGILDNYFEQITSIKSDLEESTQYYISSKNVGMFLFPPPADVNRSIDARYKAFESRSEKMVTDFAMAVTNAEKAFDAKSLKINYRIEDNKDRIYTTDLIDNGSSVLVDQRYPRDLQALISDFHVRKTMSFFKTSGVSK